MDVESVKAKFDSVKTKYNIEFDAKEEQLEVVSSIMNGRNALVLLPTGFGKTLCIVIPTMMWDASAITLVISPLTSLIDDQICRLHEMNIKCAKISGLNEMDKQTIKGNYDHA